MEDMASWGGQIVGARERGVEIRSSRPQWADGQQPKHRDPQSDMRIPQISICMLETLESLTKLDEPDRWNSNPCALPSQREIDLSDM